MQRIEVDENGDGKVELGVLRPEPTYRESSLVRVDEDANADERIDKWEICCQPSRHAGPAVFNRDR
jgi:hypothetical protein